MFQKTAETASVSTHTTSEAVTFANDLDFLSHHTEVIYLSDPQKEAGILICPALQGRIMTSTAEGLNGLSFGWINYDHISSGKLMVQINPFGGEDRFWLGPEGGQYSIFFKAGDTFDLEHVKTPPPIDTQSFNIESRSEDTLSLSKKMTLRNYSGTVFHLFLNRIIRLLSKESAWEHLGLMPYDAIKIVAFQSENIILNTGMKPWEKTSGLLSVWNLGMFKASENTIVVVPLVNSEDSSKYLNDSYFGKVPSDRIAFKNNTVFFKGDGKYRSKIGVSLKGAKPLLGSYDSVHEVLTLVEFTLPADAEDYVNSMWELQTDPFNGDVVNSYNDGPSGPDGHQLGAFYELETSSPAAALQPQESLSHIHRTYHLYGSKEALNEISEKTLGVSIEEIINSLPH